MTDNEDMQQPRDADARGWPGGGDEDRRSTEGGSESDTTSGASPRSPIGKKAIAIGAVALVAALGIVGALVVAMQPTALERAAEECHGLKALEVLGTDEEFEKSVLELVEEKLDGVLAVEDEGKTLVVRTLPSDDDPIGISALALACVEEQLEMPAWLEESISTTRALDGRQSGEWDGFSAQWGYHPDNGLNLIVVAK